MGGDEFIILLPGARLADGLKIAEKMRLAISEIPISLNSGRIKVTASLGVVQVTEDVTSIDELLCKIDPVLLRSKGE